MSGLESFHGPWGSEDIPQLAATDVANTAVPPDQVRLEESNISDEGVGEASTTRREGDLELDSTTQSTADLDPHTGELNTNSPLLGADQLWAQMQLMHGAAGVVPGVPSDTGAPLSRAVRRVMIIATSSMTCFVFLFVINNLRGHYETDDPLATVGALFLDMMVPVCGYVGALQRRKEMSCCFCSASLFLLVYFMGRLIWVQVWIGQIDGDCTRVESVEQRRTCEAWRSPSAVFEGFCEGVAMILTGLSFWFGKTLHDLLNKQCLTQPAGRTLVGTVISGPEGQEEVSQPSGASELPGVVPGDENTHEI